MMREGRRERQAKIKRRWRGAAPPVAASRREARISSKTAPLHPHNSQRQTFDLTHKRHALTHTAPLHSREARAALPPSRARARGRKSSLLRRRDNKPKPKACHAHTEPCRTARRRGRHTMPSSARSWPAGPWAGCVPVAFCLEGRGGKPARRSGEPKSSRLSPPLPARAPSARDSTRAERVRWAPPCRLRHCLCTHA